jgi:hypothetical protein
MKQRKNRGRNWPTDAIAWQARDMLSNWKEKKPDKDWIIL